MREFKGVKCRLAMEFSGWTGNSKAFQFAYRGSDLIPFAQRHYAACEIRNVRLDLLGIPHDTKRPQKVPPVICFRTAKGGVGKTTISANVGSAMAMMGHKVLLIDGDPQASLSGMYGVDWSKQSVTHIGDLMRKASRNEPANVQSAIIPMYEGGMLDLIPSAIDLANTDQWLTSMNLGRENAFVGLLEKEVEFFSQYDVIIVDSAPSSSLLTTALMIASPTVVAVVMPEGQSLGALASLESNIQELNRHFKTKAHKIHIVINRYNQSKKPHQIMLGDLLASHADYINDTIVRDFVGFLRETIGKEEARLGPLIENEPNSIGARDIIDLTKSLIKLYGITIPGSPI